MINVKINQTMIATVLTAVALNVAMFTGYNGLDEKWVAVTSAALTVLAGFLNPKSYR